MSSNTPGVFTLVLETTMLGATSRIASEDIQMEDLLKAKYEKRPSLSLFRGKVKVNFELFLYQINKKYVSNLCAKTALMEHVDFTSDLSLCSSLRTPCILRSILSPAQLIYSMYPSHLHMYFSSFLIELPTPLIISNIYFRCPCLNHCGRKLKRVHEFGVAIANRCTSLSRIPQCFIHVQIPLPASFPSSFVFPKTIGTADRWVF